MVYDDLMEAEAELEEMTPDQIKAKDWDNEKATVISWVSDFEDIVEKAEPIA